MVMTETYWATQNNYKSEHNTANPDQLAESIAPPPNIDIDRWKPILARGITWLSTRERQALLYYGYHGFSRRKVAKMLGLTNDSTIQVLFRRAQVKMLRFIVIQTLGLGGISMRGIYKRPKRRK